MDHSLEPAEVNLCKNCPDEFEFSKEGAEWLEVNMPDEEITVTEQVVEQEHERAQWRMAWRIDKYDGEVTPEMVAAGLVKPVEVVEVEGNLLCKAGINRMLDLLIGAGGQALNNANSRIGVGNGSSAVDDDDTDLSAAAGSSNRQFVDSDSTFPSRTNQTVTWQATFSTSQANFAWNEFGIDTGTAAGTTVVAPLLNHKLISAGTKTSAQTWIATATLTIA